MSRDTSSSCITGTLPGFVGCYTSSVRLRRMTDAVVFVLSIAAALGLWELISRTGLISQKDLPAMSTTFQELWSLVETGDFWIAFAQTVRGWALGLAVATALAVPIGILLGSSDFAASAFRVPIEFLRPIPSAALIPLLFLTLGTTLKSEIFLASFGAFWPLLVQTIYGVRDVDPVALDTARSFGLTEQVYALALATGFLGLAIYVVFAAIERRALRWHPSQRVEAT